MNSNNGFTLIEIIVVMAILALIIGSLLANFNSSQKKARDAQRKSDLRQIQTALETYYNDFEQYPAADILTFGSALEDESSGKVYMSVVPQDPLNDNPDLYPGTLNYQYEVVNGGQGYYLYANLENDEDSQRLREITGTSCNDDGTILCDYGVSSPNLSISP